MNPYNRYGTREVRRSPDTVRRYFATPPDEHENEIGMAAVAGAVVAVIVALMARSALLDGGSVSQDGSYNPFAALAFAAFRTGAFFGSLYVAWRLATIALRRLTRYHRQRRARVGAPTDQQMDQWFASDMKKIDQRARDQMQLPQKTVRKGPLTVVGPALPCDYAIGEDWKPRFASYEAAVVVVTEHHVCAYTCVLNFLTGVIELETTHEFMLADVTTIATINDRTANGGATSGNVIRMSGPVAMNYLTPADVSARQEFRITLTSGDAVAVNVGCHVNGTNLTDDNFREYVNNTVKALRSTMREIKSPSV